LQHNLSQKTMQQYSAAHVSASNQSLKLYL
jgi:hypothetical protein